MSKEKTLIKNTIIVTMGKISTQLISFFLLPLYTALLTTTEYGVVDLLNTLINLLIPVFIMQIDQGTFRYLIDCRGNEKEENSLITTTIYFIFMQIILYSTFFFLFNKMINNEYKYFLLFNLTMALISTVMLQISRGIGDNYAYSVGSFLAGSSTVLLNVIFIAYFRLGAYGMLLASLIGNLICSIYIFIKINLFERLSLEYYSKDVLAKLLKYSIPLVPNVISWWIVTASNRVIITLFIGLSANGVFSAANKFSGVITTIYSIFNLTWTESASMSIDNDDRDEFFSNILDKVLRIFGSICLNAITLMPIVFPILINVKFIEAYNQIPILILATLFNILISFLGSIYVAFRKTKEIAKTSILAAIINLVFNFLLIHFLGLYAASLATAFAYFVMFVYRLVDSRKYIKLKIEKKLYQSLIVVYFISISCYFLNTNLTNILMILIGLVYALILNWKMIIEIIRYVLNKLSEIKKG